MKRLLIMQIALFSFVLGTAIAFTAEINPYACIAGVGAAMTAVACIGTGTVNSFGINMTAGYAGPNGTSDNIGGTSGIIYGAATSLFTAAGITEPLAYTVATTMVEMAENADDFVFATGGRFWEFYTTENTGKLTYKEQGDMDGKSYKPEGEIFYPGDELSFMGFMRWAKNQKFIFIIPMANGVMHQVGTRAFPASFTGEWESATNSAGVKGAKMKFTTAVVSGPMIYTGAVSLTPAV